MKNKTEKHQKVKEVPIPLPIRRRAEDDYKQDLIKKVEELPTTTFGKVFFGEKTTGGHMEFLSKADVLKLLEEAI